MTWFSNKVSKYQLPCDTESYTLIGKGKPEKTCMQKVAHALSPNLDGVSFIHQKCNRYTCPNCYDWLNQKRIHKLTTIIELYALYTGERPAHIVSSINPKCFKTLADIDKFRKESYKHFKSICVEAGLRIDHPFRLKKDIVDRLRSEFSIDTPHGFWQAVRDDVLNLTDWREYVNFSPHIHGIVFPSFLKPHSDRKFIVKKIRTVKNIKDTIKLLNYQLSHIAVYTGSDNTRMDATRLFGKLHRWHPEDHFTEEDIEAMRCKVAKKMGLAWIGGKLKPKHSNITDENGKSIEVDLTDYIPMSELIVPTRDGEAMREAYLNQDGILDKNNDYFRDNLEKRMKLRDDWMDKVHARRRWYTDRDLILNSSKSEHWKRLKLRKLGACPIVPPYNTQYLRMEDMDPPPEGIIFIINGSTNSPVGV